MFGSATIYQAANPGFENQTRHEFDPQPGQQMHLLQATDDIHRPVANLVIREVDQDGRFGRVVAQFTLWNPVIRPNGEQFFLNGFAAAPGTDLDEENLTIRFTRIHLNAFPRR